MAKRSKVFQRISGRSVDSGPAFEARLLDPSSIGLRPGHGVLTVVRRADGEVVILEAFEHAESGAAQPVATFLSKLEGTVAFSDPVLVMQLRPLLGQKLELRPTPIADEMVDDFMYHTQPWIRVVFASVYSPALWSALRRFYTRKPWTQSPSNIYFQMIPERGTLAWPFFTLTGQNGEQFGLGLFQSEIHLRFSLDRLEDLAEQGPEQPGAEFQEAMQQLIRASGGAPDPELSAMLQSLLADAGGARLKPPQGMLMLTLVPKEDVPKRVRKRFSENGFSTSLPELSWFGDIPPWQDDPAAAAPIIESVTAALEAALVVKPVAEYTFQTAPHGTITVRAWTEGGWLGSDVLDIPLTDECE